MAYTIVMTEGVGKNKKHREEKAETYDYALNIILCHESANMTNSAKIYRDGYPKLMNCRHKGCDQEIVSESPNEQMCKRHRLEAGGVD